MPSSFGSGVPSIRCGHTFEGGGARCDCRTCGPCRGLVLQFSLPLLAPCVLSYLAVLRFQTRPLCSSGLGTLVEHRPVSSAVVLDRHLTVLFAD